MTHLVSFANSLHRSSGDMWKYVVLSFDHVKDHQEPSRFHRSISRPAFSRDRISDLELFDRHAAMVISKLKQRLRQGYAVDFQVRFLYIHHLPIQRHHLESHGKVHARHDHRIPFWKLRPQPLS
jgi:hypothetical protein